MSPQTAHPARRTHGLLATLIHKFADGAQLNASSGPVGGQNLNDEFHR
jgi:hypothetical protein